jgi:hypothetical protein
MRIGQIVLRLLGTNVCLERDGEGAFQNHAESREVLFQRVRHLPDPTTSRLTRQLDVEGTSIFLSSIPT